MNTRLLFPVACVTAIAALWWYTAQDLSPKSAHALGDTATAIAPASDSSRADVVQAATTTKQAADTSTPVASTPLLPAHDELWQKPVSEPQFAAFKEWTERYLAATPDKRRDLVQEGVRLAATRQRAMADTIIARPERALELAVPQSMREELPHQVTEKLEQQINTRGNFFVAGTLPIAGTESDTVPTTRWAEIGGETLAVSTFGRGLSYVTKSNVPLNGIALPVEALTNPLAGPDTGAKRVMALDPNPVRKLEKKELKAKIEAADATPICSVSNLEVTANDEPAGGQLGGELFTFCASMHLQNWANGAVLASGLDTTGGTAAAGVAASGYTEGYKRFLYLRVKFPDATNMTITQSAAQTLHTDMMEYMARMSYDKLHLAPLGNGGSAITEELLLPQNVAYYDDGGLSRLYPDARTAASNAGYDLSQYDFFAVFTGSKPAANYAGLAYVGGIGIHIANGYFGKGVLAHEFGHNLGLPHAHRWNTNGETIIGTGTNDEYGNSYDPIGGGTGDNRAQYTASHKMSLDWIPAADSGRITTSGLYRLYACDSRTGTQGRRTLRVAKDTGHDYFADYRGGWDTAKLDGLFLHFANTNGRESYMVDAQPKRGGSLDLLPIGRTFDDVAAGVHITPVKRYATVPASIDVQVTVGNPSGNRAPVGRLTATSLQPAVNVPVTINCNATDADGDTLAYWWDFGDGTSSVDNQPAQTHTFTTAGEYVVHCTISDGRGGLDRRSVLLQAGGPPSNQFRISGRVLDKTNKPLAGYYVSTQSSQYAWTDTDGSYTLTRLAAGQYTLNAQELTTGTQTVSRVFFTNPVTVGPNATNIDFNEPSTPPETLTPVVAKTSTWKYNDLGVDLGTAWQGASYDDSTWASGLAMLGYGNGGEGTIVSYGTDANNKRTTCYFRKHFNVANPAAFNELRLETKRDDGVIVYLNGVEIFRDNMPASAVTYATAAVDQVEPDSFLLKTGISPSLLVAGDNVISAEIHQVLPSSSDLAFDLGLSGVSTSVGPGTTMAAITNVSDGAIFTAPVASIALQAIARADNTTVTKVEFFADNVKLGETTNAPYSFSWNNPAVGAHVVHVVATLSAGGTITSPKVNVSVMNAPSTLLARGAGQWRYLVGNSAPTTGWQNTSFNDATWSLGTAQLGFGDGDEVTTIPSGQIAYYFRHSFDIVDPFALSQVRVRLLLDDGAVVYLNGAELTRTNMPSGAITNTTLASANSVENVWEEFEVPTSLLRPGRNVLAVEVHQVAATSSDVSFDAELVADIGTPRARSITAVAPVSTVQPDAVVLSAEALAGAGLDVNKVEFFADGAKIGEDTTYPWSLNWTNPTIGSHTIEARATDTAGQQFASAPVPTQVLAPEAATALVSFNQIWKYLDSGVYPGDTWTSRTAYDDTSWAQSQARFGYGGDGELTTVSYGSNDSAKNITTWFRKKFSVSNPATFNALLVRVIRDDGVRVFLNGTEIVRNNLPSETITFATLATAVVDAAAETTPVEFIVPATALLSGENQLAVEVHQQSASSSDLGFDLALYGLTSPATPPAIYLTSPASSEQIHPGNGINLAASTFAGSSVSRVEFYAGNAKIGEDTTAPYSSVWTTPLVGTYSLSARAVLTNGSTLTSTPVAVNVTAPLVHTPVVVAGSAWKYTDDGLLPSPTWMAPGYDDSTWKSGNGRFGFGNDGEVTHLTPGSIAYYFRRTFTVPAVGAFTGYTFRVQRDDGIVVYLDGSEIARLNMPAGTVNSTTLASTAIANADETAWIDVPLPLAQLTPGNHVLAVEAHQNSSTSSDIGFNAALTLDYTAPGGVYNTPPSTVPVPTLSASLQSPGTMQFRINEQDGRVYQLEWSDDLVTWNIAGTAIVTGGRIDWSIPTAGVPKRFFRARWVSSP
ncbi:Ig-like domain-containing protein [Verrucomicrobiota bacterium sgz303538]